MNGFDLHNIQHTSPSQINTFTEAPDVWIADKLFGFKGGDSASGCRGKAVEIGVIAVLLNKKTYQEALEIAIKQYNKETALMTDQSVSKERGAIAGCLEQALAALEPYGVPDEIQKEIALICNGDGWRLPVKGYTDFTFNKHGLIVDLKTSLRVPSFMSLAHKRAAVIYKMASGNKAVKFLYCTPKKYVWHEVEDVTEVVTDIKYNLNRMEKFLRLGDKDFLKSIVHVQPNSFMWKLRGLEDKRKELYGI